MRIWKLYKVCWDNNKKRKRSRRRNKKEKEEEEEEGERERVSILLDKCQYSTVRDPALRPPKE